MDFKEIWKKCEKPPKEAVTPITGGRLKGKSDIKPIWRIDIMTQMFGVCGEGWKYEITDKWREDVANGEVLCFISINLFFKNNDVWSEPVPGIGGAHLIAKEKSGLYCDNDAYKKALTDALSVAMKGIGVGASVYYGGKIPSENKYNGSGSHESTTDKGIKMFSELIKNEFDKDQLLEVFIPMGIQDRRKFYEQIKKRINEVK